MASFSGLAISLLIGILSGPRRPVKQNLQTQVRSRFMVQSSQLTPENESSEQSTVNRGL